MDSLQGTKKEGKGRGKEKKAARKQTDREKNDNRLHLGSLANYLGYKKVFAVEGSEALLFLETALF